MKRKLFAIIWILLPLGLFAQDSLQGKVVIDADPAIDRIMQRRKEFFGLDSTTAGYRIQIYSGTDRNEAMLELENFQLKYPEVKVYLKYDSPNFKIRIGDFSGKVEAQYWFAILQEEYPRLFLVPDRINPRDRKSVV